MTKESQSIIAGKVKEAIFMTKKEQAIRSAVKFLMHIYNEDMEICAKLATAEADNDIETILHGLDTVAQFCNKLKTDIKHEDI